MKRKIFLLTAIILSFSLVLTACGQKDIGEAKAKQLALDSINKLFHTNQTEATVSREEMGCLPDQVAAMATMGDAEETSRWLYIVSVPSRDEDNYLAYVVASTGEVEFISQNEYNITLTDEQQKQAEELLAAEANYGNEHYKAFALMKDACREWAIANLGDAYPILLDADNGRMTGTPARETFAVNYYVVTNDDKVYCITMFWPSMQVLSIDTKNAK